MPVIASPQSFLRIHIPTPLHRNRAMHGDVVFVEVLPRSEWTQPHAVHVGDQDQLVQGPLVVLPSALKVAQLSYTS